MGPRVELVKALDAHQLELTFTNGEIRRYDCCPLLDFGVFRELRNETYFQQVTAVGGTVVWPNEQDICPDTLYMDSVPLSANAKAGSA